jgi:hypothetical protein
MTETDFAELAVLVAAIAGADGTRPKDAWREEIVAFRRRFTRMAYCF